MDVISRHAQLSALIHDGLRTDLARLSPLPSDDAISRRAVARLRALVDAAPAFLLLLAEPWLKDESEDLLPTLLDCARVHLYARILDDALDESLLPHRIHLLRYQPIFWQTVAGLAVRFPHLQVQCTHLIGETVMAVEADDAGRAPRYWGRKNHHLLLLPLLLSGDDARYHHHRETLSTLISLSQACDEWWQGELCPAVTEAVLDIYPSWMEPERLLSLHRDGWCSASARIIREGQYLLEQIALQKT
ncbi:hypothetical protein ACB316_17080 [Aeromonas sanarellii]